MLFYCFKCRKNTESKNQKVVKAKRGRIMFTSNCAVYSSKNSRHKEQESKGQLCRISKTLLLGPFLIQLKIALMHLKIIIHKIK